MAANEGLTPGPASRPRLLAWATVAFVAAALLTVAFIMPAEFHSDPLGVGKLTGLDRLAGPKEAPIATPRATAGGPAARLHETPWRSDEIVIPLTAGGREGSELEYKVRMKHGSTLIYSWSETGAPAEEFYADFHGQTLPARPGAEVQVATYHQATGDSASGSLVAPLDGVHGWYLQNQAVSKAVVTLKLAGFYELVPPGKVGNEAGIVAPGQVAAQ